MIRRGRGCPGWARRGARRAHRERLGAVPRAAPERVVRGELPARVEGIDAELLRIAGDVGIGVEVLGGRLVAQARDQLPKGLLACGRSLLLRHEHVGFDDGGLKGHDSSSLYAPGGRGLGPSTTAARSFSTAISSLTRWSSAMAMRSRARPWRNANVNAGTRSKRTFGAAASANSSR